MVGIELQDACVGLNLSDLARSVVRQRGFVADLNESTDLSQSALRDSPRRRAHRCWPAVEPRRHSARQALRGSRASGSTTESEQQQGGGGMHRRLSNAVRVQGWRWVPRGPIPEQGVWG